MSPATAIGACRRCESPLERGDLRCAIEKLAPGQRPANHGGEQQAKQEEKRAAQAKKQAEQETAT